MKTAKIIRRKHRVEKALLLAVGGFYFSCFTLKPIHNSTTPVIVFGVYVCFPMLFVSSSSFKQMSVVVCRHAVNSICCCRCLYRYNMCTMYDFRLCDW